MSDFRMGAAEFRFAELIWANNRIRLEENHLPHRAEAAL